MEDEVLLFADLCPNLGTIPGESENSVPAEELDDATKSIEESYKAALANEKRLEESTRGSAQAVKDAIAQGATNADDAWDILDLDNYPDLDEKSFKRRWNYDMGRGGPSTGSTSSTFEPAKPKVTLDDVQNMDVSDDLKLFVRQLQRTADASEEVIDSVQDSVNHKFGRIERFTAQIVSGRFAKKHLMIAGDAGCGKTYSVTHTLESKGLRKNRDTEHACTGSHEYCYAKGSIGKAITPVTLFFYRHKDDNLIVLDDCDAFLTEALHNDQLSNFFKALFENEVEPVPGQAGRSQAYVNVSPNIARLVNKYVGHASSMEESGSHLAINKDRLLNEHVFEVTVNGHKFEEKLDENEFENLIGKNASRKLNEKKFGKRDVLARRKLYVEAIEDDDFDEQEDEDIEFDGVIAGDLEELSGGFYYKPCTIFISNLSSADLPDAVESRFNIVNLTLTPEEFLCRAEMILGSLQLAQGSTFTKDELDFYKRQVHGALKHVITAIDKGIPIDNGKVPIRNKDLQFRIYNDLVGLYAYEEDVWMDKHDPKEELKRAYASLKTEDPAAAEKLRTLKTAKEVASYFVQQIFIKRDLIPYLRAADKEKKRR